MFTKTRKRIEALEERVKELEMDVLSAKCKSKGGYYYAHSNPPHCQVKDKEYEVKGFDFICKKIEQFYL